MTTTNETTTMTNNNPPRIYVACLASYNAGTLYGRWIDVTPEDTEGTIEEQIDAMIQDSPTEGAEEWEIHDYDGVPSDLIGEPLSALVSYVEALDELDEDEHEAYRVWVDAQCVGTDDLGPDAFREQYAGEFRSFEDFGAELWDQCGLDENIPENLRIYIDHESFGRDLVLGGDYWTDGSDHEGRGHYFRNY